jgi:hypothetical protein
MAGRLRDQDGRGCAMICVKRQSTWCVGALGNMTFPSHIRDLFLNLPSAIAMANSIRGDGLFEAHRALAKFAENEGLQEQARRRFDRLPRQTSPSGDTTRSHSPDHPNPYQLAVNERRFQLKLKYRASMPRTQYHDQVREYARLKDVPIGSLEADNHVKRDWCNRGIWRSEWNAEEPGLLDAPGARWRHQDQDVSASESEPDTDTASSITVFGKVNKRRHQKKRRSDEEMQRVDREASRPLPQFIHQIETERRHILDDGLASDAPADINTKAYAIVKEKWQTRGIWNTKWGLLPGRTWKHEHPLEELLADDAMLATLMGRAAERAHQEEDLRPRAVFANPEGQILELDVSSPVTYQNVHEAGVPRTSAAARQRRAPVASRPRRSQRAKNAENGGWVAIKPLGVSKRRTETRRQSAQRHAQQPHSDRQGITYSR